jgi:hypothetical protein
VQLINQTWWCVVLFAEAALWIKIEGVGVENQAGLEAEKPNPCVSKRGAPPHAPCRGEEVLRPDLSNSEQTAESARPATSWGAGCFIGQGWVDRREKGDRGRMAGTPCWGILTSTSLTAHLTSSIPGVPGSLTILVTLLSLTRRSVESVNGVCGH